MISLIVAMTRKGLIGKDNDLPWNYPEDLKYFKKTTLNKTVAMGEKTFLSIHNRNQKPLPKRKNVVFTFDKDFKCEGVEVSHDLHKYLQEYKGDDLFIIGGREIYREALPYCKYLYITFIEKEYEGNVYFPKVNFDNYKIISEEKLGELTFTVFERR